jgi:flagellar hook-associated protein 1 FlgK
MSLLGLLSTARDALLAQTAGLDITGQNVANASTPGYVRRVPILETRQLGASQGTVQFTGIRRQFERFAYARALAEQGRHGSAASRSDALGKAESILAPGYGGIDQRLAAFFQASQALVAYPSDTSARQQLLASAQGLADSVSAAAGDLLQQRQDLAQRAGDIAAKVNQDLKRIADLNRQIAQAQGQGDGAASLRDQRDELVRDVADLVGAKTIQDDQGHFTLLSSGVAVITDDSASSFGVALDKKGALQITIQRPGGSTTDVTSQIDSGQLGGVREARDVDIPNAQNQLDQFAYDLAVAVNGVHAVGFGLDGISGRNLFTAPQSVSGAAYAMSLDAQMIGHPERVAAAESANAVPGGSGAALALAKLASTTLGNGPGTPAERFAAILTGLGSAKSGSDAELALRDSTLAQAKNMESSASGVSIDEEMVDLARYQRAFEASMRVMRVADELMEVLVKGL